MERKNIFFILFAFSACQMVKTGVMPMFEIIQDEIILEKNELTEYLTIQQSLLGAGTVDAILNLDIEVLKTIPENFRILLKLERQTAGKYISTGVNIDQPYCEFTNNDKVLLPLLAKFGNFASKCPIEAGHYYVKNATFKGQQLPLAVPLGNYRATFRYSIADKATVLLWKGRFVKA